jgi:hypothetical protein
MNKKIIAGLIALILTIPATSHANIKNKTLAVPTLAILDTALDTSIPSIKSKLLHEVCILEWTTCPNGQSFMEGPGSSHLPLSSITKNGFDHGTQMASAAINANPNMNIVFVRIIGQNINHDRQIANESTVYNALNWVIANRDRFNIQAVSMSQGVTNLPVLINYCPTTPMTQQSIKNLIAVGVPTFIPVGNSRNYKMIDWPSCLPEAFAIGAGSRNGIELYSNYDPMLVDFFSNGNVRVTAPGNVTRNAAGTSISAQIAAAQWIALKQSKPNLSIAQLSDLISKTARPIKGRQGAGKLFDLNGAING